MDGLGFIIAAMATIWLWRKQTVEPKSAPPPKGALSPVYRVALGFIVGVFILTAFLLSIFVL